MKLVTYLSEKSEVHSERLYQKRLALRTQVREEQKRLEALTRIQLHKWGPLSWGEWFHGW